MEFCNYLRGILHSSSCCNTLFSHSHGQSIGSLVISEGDSNSISSISDISPIDQSLKNQSSTSNHLKGQKAIENLDTHLTTPAFQSQNDSIVSIDGDLGNIWEAVDENDIESIKSYLLTKDLNELTDFEGLGLIHRSVIAGNLEMTEILAQTFDVNAKDNLGRTALHYASMKNNIEIALLLLKSGASVMEHDGFGKMPEDYCENHKEMRWVLETAEDMLRREVNSKSMVNKVNNSLKISNSLLNFSDFCLEDRNSIGNKKHRRLTCPKDDVVSINKLKDYKILRVLRKSNFGEVFLIRNEKSGALYSMKVMDKTYLSSKNLLSTIETERNMLTSLHHPFITPLISTFQTSKKLLLVTHYCSKGALSQQMHSKNPLQVESIKLYACEIILALMYLHEKDYIYGSLKPQNILVNEDGHIMLSEFSLSTQGFLHDEDSREENKAVMCARQSLGYLPPEILAGNPYGKEADWYMLGLVLYEMATGCEFIDRESRKMINHEEMGDLVDKLVDPMPWKRIGFNRGEEIKEHAFFKGVDWDKVLKKEIVMPRIDTTDISMQFVNLNISFDEIKQSDAIMPKWSYGDTF